MSWQSYIDDQLMNTNLIKHAVIAGHDGNIWATSKEFKVSADELKKLLQNYDDTSSLQQSGPVVGGVKYMFLSKNDRVLRLKYKQGGCHCIKTVQALILCVYEPPTMPEQVATVTERLGEYLISVGY